MTATIKSKFSKTAATLMMLLAPAYISSQMIHVPLTPHYHEEV
jgi:hypothetical protein